MDAYLPADFVVTHMLWVCFALSLGGLVKGVSSFGLPTVAVPIMAFIFPVPIAVSIIVLPMLITNFYQTLISGHFSVTLKRHWRLLLPLLIVLAISIPILSKMDPKILMLITGLVLILITTLELRGVVWPGLPDRENILSPLVGAISGLIGSVTSFFGIIPIFYFVALKLPKEQFVAAVSMTLFLGCAVMTISMARLDFLGRTELTYAVCGFGPLFLGMYIGTKLRGKFNQDAFRKFVLCLIALMGGIMIARSFI